MAPGQIRHIRSALACRGRHAPCFFAVSPLGYSHIMAISATMLRSIFGLGCPTCSTKPHGLTECNRPTVFTGATRYSPMTISGIGADLRASCPVAPRGTTLPPFQVARPVTRSSACGHLEAILIPRTLLLPSAFARWLQGLRVPSLRFACPTLSSN